MGFHVSLGECILILIKGPFQALEEAFGFSRLPGFGVRGVGLRAYQWFPGCTPKVVPLKGFPNIALINPRGTSLTPLGLDERG